MCSGTVRWSCWSGGRELSAPHPVLWVHTRTHADPTVAGAGSWPEGWWVSPRSLEPGYDPLEAAEDIPAGEQQTARSKTNQKVSLNTSQKLPGVSPQSVSPTNPQNGHGPVLNIKIHLDCSLGWKDGPITMVWSSLAWLNCSRAEFKKAIIDNLRGYLQKE